MDQKHWGNVTEDLSRFRRAQAAVRGRGADGSPADGSWRLTLAKEVGEKVRDSAPFLQLYDAQGPSLQ